jgi:hypothetical protein
MDSSKRPAAGKRPAARQARRCSAGERRRKRYTALGCTVCCGIFTRMYSGARRALRWPPGEASSATRRSERRRGGRAPVRKTRRHGARGRLQASQATSLPSGEGAETAAGRRELGSTAAARTETAAGCSSRVGRRRPQALGF